MKLNERGQVLYDKWCKIYEAELNRLRVERNDPNYEEGWCIIENERFVETIPDVVGLMLFGYDYHALETIDQWIHDFGEEDCYFNYPHRIIKKALEECFEREEKMVNVDNDRYLVLEFENGDMWVVGYNTDNTEPALLRKMFGALKELGICSYCIENVLDSLLESDIIHCYHKTDTVFMS